MLFATPKAAQVFIFSAILIAVFILFGNPTYAQKHYETEASKTIARRVSQEKDWPWRFSLSNLDITHRRIFEKLNLAPILVPEGEKVGDILDRANARLIIEGKDCFNKLRVVEEKSSLPTISTRSLSGFAASLGVGALAEIKGEFDKTVLFQIEHSDVFVSKASSFQLRNSLNRKIPECRKVAPFLDALLEKKLTDDIQSEPPIVIGTVFYAKRNIKIFFSSNLSAEGRASFSNMILEVLGLSSVFVPKINTAGRSGQDNVVEFSSKHTIAVALAPAYLVSRYNSGDGYEKFRISRNNYDDFRRELLVSSFRSRFFAQVQGEPFRSDQRAMAALEKPIGVDSLRSDRFGMMISLSSSAIDDVVLANSRIPIGNMNYISIIEVYKLHPKTGKYFENNGASKHHSSIRIPRIVDFDKGIADNLVKYYSSQPNSPWSNFLPSFSSTYSRR